MTERHHDTADDNFDYAHADREAHLHFAHELAAMAVADPAVRQRAIELAAEDGVKVSITDLEASTGYLKKCLERRSHRELEDLIDQGPRGDTRLSKFGKQRLAALWARGASGARAWRHGKQHASR